MNIVDVEQGSPEWLAVRVGKVTASRVAEIMAKTKSGASRSARQNYLAELIAERLTGRPAARFLSQAMAWGTEQEPAAKLEYAFTRDVVVKPVGFVMHPHVDHFGASPDGLVTDPNGDVGLVEVKCPFTATHIATLQSERVPGEYVWQIQAQLACTGLGWADFVSFDPRLPPALQLFVKRVDRDDELIEAIEAEVGVFIDELDGALADLKKRFAVEEVPADV
jgi:putative phage-type endonuclease